MLSFDAATDVKISLSYSLCSWTQKRIWYQSFSEVPELGLPDKAHTPNGNSAIIFAVNTVFQTKPACDVTSTLRSTNTVLPAIWDKHGDWPDKMVWFGSDFGFHVNRFEKPPFLPRADYFGWAQTRTKQPSNSSPEKQ